MISTMIHPEDDAEITLEEYTREDGSEYITIDIKWKGVCVHIFPTQSQIDSLRDQLNGLEKG